MNEEQDVQNVKKLTGALFDNEPKAAYAAIKDYTVDRSFYMLLIALCSFVSTIYKRVEKLEKQ